MKDQETVEKLVLMLVSGVVPEAVQRAGEKMGLGERKAKRLLKKAQQSITIAANYSREDETGTAYLRLNDLYTRAIKVGDAKTALAAQRELNRLMALYDHPQAEGDQSDAGDNESSHELDLIRQHLLPLNLAPETYPISEHSRIAADRLRRAKGLA